ncbi:MAG: hypothetical protein Q7R95_07330 [bacterium]|nr:hypothetical protein [bacterium]
MTKKEKRFNLWLKDKNFEKNKLKNIILSVCHSESTVARTAKCYFCDRGVSKKEQNKSRYGFRYADFENKRHRSKRKPEPYRYAKPRHFLKDVCMDCVQELELALNFEFEKSFAP